MLRDSTVDLGWLPASAMAPTCKCLPPEPSKSEIGMAETGLVAIVLETVGASNEHGPLVLGLHSRRTQGCEREAEKHCCQGRKRRPKRAERPTELLILPIKIRSDIRTRSSNPCTGSKMVA